MSARVHDEVVAAPPDALSLVLGAPGSGKTSLLVHRLVALVEHGVTPDDQLIITPSRAQASVLRDRVGLELGLTTRGPRVRSLAAVAFSIVEAFHAQEHLAPPDLLQGSQIDAD
ncbi:MAG: AAA family ATPase, partial [Microbacteriaceae bacterium]|nr:AAA family ATPase [Microbacteriaceae bacterium]